MRAPKNESLGLGLVAAGLLALVLTMPGLVVPAGPAPLRVLFGWGAFVAVAALVLGGIAVVFAGHVGWQVRWGAVAAGEVLYVAVLSLLHLGQADPHQAAYDGRGGGLVGWSVAQLLELALPRPFTWVLAAAGALLAAWWLWRALPPIWTGWLSPRVKAEAGSSNDSGTRPRAFFSREGISALLAWLRQLIVNLNPNPSRPATQDGAKQELPEAQARPRGGSRAATPGAARPAQAAPSGPESAPVPSGESGRPWRRKRRPDRLPPMDVLRPDDGRRTHNTNSRQRAQTIKETLAEFGVPVEVVSIKEGPTVTQFGLEPGEIVKELRGGEVQRRRVSVHSIMRLSNDLALALAAPSIRIEAPVPGRPYVGIEVPNPAKTLVPLRNILESREFGRISSPLAAALGRDVSGDPIVIDLTSLPHLLIAGATGSGKSVCINAIVCSLLMSNGPETVRLLLVDPKMVELPVYNGIPHLLGPVITDVTQVPGALAWLTLQMDDRYRTFADRGVRNIEEYNRKAARSKSREPLPYMVLIIDELADLMMTAAMDVERQICRLAQMARATGIHLVLATQRPSVDVITGLIKANFPARIAFAVSTQVDSRVVLDVPGAEKLLGRGDMLFMAPDSPKLARIQGCYVSDREIDQLVSFWQENRPGDESESTPAPWASMVSDVEARDELLETALQLLQTKTHISTSLLQRQLRIGFPRAARLMEQLEQMGVVGPDEGGGRSREVLLRSDTEAVE